MSTISDDMTELEEYQLFVGNMTSKNVLGTDMESYWACSGLMCESAELLELHEKNLRKHNDLGVDVEKIMDELGDVLWYAAAVANANGLTLDEVIENNISKLIKRTYSSEST